MSGVADTARMIELHRAATAKLAKLRRLLRRARRFVEEERDLILESNCLLDRRTLKPRRETLNAMGRPHVLRCERLMARIDRALGAEP